MRAPMRAWGALVPVLLLAAGLAALGTFGASRLSRLQERRRQHEQELQAASLAAGRLLEALSALQQRHPELDLGPEDERIRTLEAASPEGRLRDLAQAEQALAALEERLLRNLSGLSAESGRWSTAEGCRSFSPAGFRDLSDRVSQPDTREIPAAPEVTGEEAADRRIVALAESRGYRLRRQMDESRLAAAGPGQALHPLALDDWRRLQQAAAAEGITLELVSGYRSVARQREIFLVELRAAGERVLGRPYRPEEIASGAADQAILAILRFSSIPGYSKHHSGCALDLGDPSSGLDFTEFARTPAHRWLSQHNYLNAKRFGFIPSYPSGAPAQGPDPEPWEYLWVGDQHLRRAPPVAGAGGR